MRMFQNKDNTKSFLAKLTGYDNKTQNVTVRMKNGRTTTFPITVLSPDDQAYVKANGKQLAIASDIEIGLTKFQDKSVKKTAPRITNRVYPSGYNITLNNRSKNTYDNISVKYTLYYEVQGYVDSQRSKMRHHGTLDYGQIVDKERVTLQTEKIDIISGKLEPLIKYKRINQGNGQIDVIPEVVEPGGRRKDLLTGCKVEILINGKVVKSDVDGKIPEEARE